LGRKERPARLGGTKRVASHTLTALAWEADRGERQDRATLERILPAIAGALGSEYFLASEAIASAYPALVLVLAGMNARRLGKLLRRGDGVPVAGYVVHARGTETGAVL
jgi:hypothetical protein